MFSSFGVAPKQATGDVAKGNLPAHAKRTQFGLYCAACKKHVGRENLWSKHASTPEHQSAINTLPIATNTQEKVSSIQSPKTVQSVEAKPIREPAAEVELTEHEARTLAILQNQKPARSETQNGMPKDFFEGKSSNKGKKDSNDEALSEFFDLVEVVNQQIEEKRVEDLEHQSEERIQLTQLENELYKARIEAMKMVFKRAASDSEPQPDADPTALVDAGVLEEELLGPISLTSTANQDVISSAKAAILEQLSIRKRLRNDEGKRDELASEPVKRKLVTDANSLDSEDSGSDLEELLDWRMGGY